MDDLPVREILIAAAVLFGVFLLGRASMGRKKSPRNPIREARRSDFEQEHRACAPRTSGDPAEMVASLSASERAEVERWIRDGKKINAIKDMREMTNRGLREAKEAVEWLETQI